MEKNFNNIDDLFKEELGGYTETPPPMVWDALEKRLQGDDKRRVYPYRWLWYFSIVSFIVLLGSSIAWMMGGHANNPAKVAAIASTMPSALGSDNAAKHVADAGDKNNTMPDAAQTKKGHRKTQHTIATNTTNNNTPGGRPGTKRNHIRQTKQDSKTTPGKPTNDDLYADTDDDQYTVGGTGSRKQNYDVPVASTSTFITKARSQHNIHVAETDPTETGHENNYGSRAVVSNATAASVTNAHYDIDLDDATTATETPKRRIVHTSNHVKTARNTNTGIARNTSAGSTKHDEAAIAATHTTKPVRTTPAKSTAGVATIPVAIVRAGTHARHHNTASAPQQPEPVIAATKGANQTSKTVATTEHPVADKKAVPTTTTTDKNTLASVPVKTAPAKTETGNKATVEKVTPAVVTPAATSSSIAANAPKSKHHTRAHAIQSNSPQAAITVASQPVAMNTTETSGTKSRTKEAAKTTRAETPETETAKTVKSVTPVAAAGSEPKAVAVAKTKHHTQSKPAVNHYAAGNSTKAAKTPSANDKAAVAAAKQPKASKPVEAADAKTTLAKNTTTPATATEVATTGNDKGKTGAEAKEDNTGEKIVAVKKTADHKTRAEKKQALPKEVKQDDKAAATVDKPIATTGKVPKKEAARKGHATPGNTATPAVIPPANTYSSSIPKRTLEDETVVIDNLKVNNFEAQESLTANNSQMLPGTFKNDNEVDKSKAAGADVKELTDSTAKHHFFSKNFEAGVKAGFETGFNPMGGNKLVIEPYLQYNLSDKFSLLTQPAIKVSHVSNTNVGDTKSYNDPGNGTYTETGSGAVYIIAYVGSSSVSTEYTLRKYRFTYDSIVKSYHVGGTYAEAELPLLLKYKIGKGLSVYGGANAVFSKYTGLKESTKKYTGDFNTMTFMPASVVRNDTLPITANLKLPGTPISQYSGPLYPTEKGSILRLGYMLGFSYEYKKRWLADVLVQQAMVKPNNEAGVNTNAPLSMPYFRITLGYKLTK